MATFHTSDLSTADLSDAIRPATPSLEFVFQIHMRLTRPSILKTTGLGVERAAIYITDGRISGPGIQGKVVSHSGGDWAVMRPDAVLDFDARYMLETDDGKFIYMTNRGYRWSTPEVNQRLMRGEPVDPSEYYMRVTPRFEVEPGSYDWLNRHVFVGVGERTPDGNVIRYYKLL